MDNLTWILVADASQARIFEAHKAQLFTGDAGKLTLVSKHSHEESRKKDIELVSDKHGEFGTGTFVDSTDPKRYEEERFAVELIKKLSKAHEEKQFKELIFIAPPQFMGMLNKHLPKTMSKLANITIEKDYTHCNEKELAQRLLDFL